MFAVMNKPIHVVHIIPTLRFGGAERCVVDIARLIDKEKFKITIVVLKPDVPMAEQLPADVQLIVASKKELKNILTELKPDIVHTHLFGGDFWGVLAARHLGVPIVSTEHNINVGESWLRTLCKRYSLRFVTTLVASSCAIAADMHPRYGVTDDIVLARYGVDLHRWQHLPLLPIKPGQEINFLILGRLVEQKGHTIALHALKQMTDLPWKLMIVGDGEWREKLMFETNRLGLSERVEFFPATKDTEHYLRQAHVLLVPSLWEGLGIVVMEAMAAGRVVVASNTGGIPELITDHSTGYLLPKGDVEAWSTGLRTIFSDERINTVAIAAKEYAIKHFAIEKMVQTYETLYADLERP